MVGRRAQTPLFDPHPHSLHSLGTPPITQYTCTCVPSTIPSPTCTTAGTGVITTTVAASANPLACSWTGLPANTMYTCFASADNGSGPQCSAASSVTVQGPPSAPAITSATSLAAGTLAVAWSAPVTLGTPAATSYVVVCADSTVASPTCNSSGAGTITATVSVPTTTETFTNLIGGTVYTCFVSVTNVNGQACSAVSSSVTVRTSPPSAPTVTSVTSPDSGELSVSATASSDPGNPAVTAYTLRCVPSNATTQGCLSTSTGVEQITLPAASTLSNLFTGGYGDTLYTCYALTTNINATVCSVGFPYYTLPYPVAPGTPTNVTNSLYVTNESSVTLTWTDGVPLGEYDCRGGGGERQSERGSRVVKWSS